MSYEYETQMGYLEPMIEAPRRVVEVYGTMPEAQEFIQDAFGLPGLPPAAALQPPMNPRTDPYRRISVLPIESPMGEESSGRSFWQRYQGWFIAAGVVAGGYMVAKSLGWIGDKRIFENPPIKDRKKQEEDRNGYIPVTRGILEPVDPDQFQKGRKFKKNEDFVQACLDLDPEAITYKRTPASIPYLVYGPDKKISEVSQQCKKIARASVEDRARKALASANGQFTPEDWVGRPRLFARFRSFVDVFSEFSHRTNSVERSCRLLQGPSMTSLFEMWMLLGMPPGSRMTKKAKSLLSSIGRAKEHMEPFLKLHRALEDLRFDGCDADVVATIVWQLLATNRVFELKVSDMEHEVRALLSVDQPQYWRVRWFVEESISSVPTTIERRRGGRRVRRVTGPVEVDWSMLDAALEMSETEFVKFYASDTTDTYLRLHGRVPKSETLACLDAKVAAALPIKHLMTTIRSPELKSFVDGEAESAFQESVEDSKRTLQGLKDRAHRRDNLVQSLETQLKQSRATRIDHQAARRLLLEDIKRLEEVGDARTSSEDEQLEWLYFDYEYIFRQMQISPPRLVEKKLRQMRAARGRLTKRINRAEKQLTKIESGGPDDQSKWVMSEIIDERDMFAAQLSLIFGQKWKAWLKRMRKRGFSVHDAVQWLPLVASPGLGDYLLKFWKTGDRRLAEEEPSNDIETLSVIARSWNELTTGEQKLRPKDLLAAIRAKAYPSAQLMDLANEAAHWGVSAEDYAGIEERVIAARLLFSQRTEKISAGDQAFDMQFGVKDAIPEYSDTIDGYTIFKVDKMDPRGIFLGEHTDCCQHVRHFMGYTCAWYGLESPESGFYAVANPRGKIVAQSWVWKNDDFLVFDNIEGQGIDEPGKRQDVVIALFQRLSDWLVQTPGTGIKETRIGWESMEIPVPSQWSVAKELVPLPEDYEGGYSDSQGFQVIPSSHAALEEPEEAAG